MTNYQHWSDLAFASKKPLRDLEATFIAAPREISLVRFKQLIKMYLPKGNIVLGMSTQSYIGGKTGQPQFRSLQINPIRQLIEKTNALTPQRQISVLYYTPTDEPHVISKNLFHRYVFINGSWEKSFHLRPVFYELAKLKAEYELVSPFASETEAKSYAATIWPEVEATTPLPNKGSLLTAREALDLAIIAGQRSFDHTFQTGAVLAKPLGKDKYEYIATSWNAIVPYQTYAMHHGAAREQYFSPPGDLNYYDTNHAEVALLVQAITNHFEFTGNTLFINLLPCPTCARMLSTTGLSEVIYQFDHSAGYAAQMFESGNTRVRIL